MGNDAVVRFSPYNNV